MYVYFLNDSLCDFIFLFLICLFCYDSFAQTITTKDGFFYDSNGNRISYEAFKDSLATSEYAIAFKAVGDTLKTFLNRKTPEYSELRNYRVSSVLKGMDGDGMKIGEEGKLSVVTFWSTTCAPCLKTLRLLNELATEYREEVNFYAVTEEDSMTLKNFQSINPNNDWPNIQIFIDSERKMEKDLHVSSHPCHMIFDKDNNVVKRIMGVRIREIVVTLEKLIRNSNLQNYE